jgi:hypothetical protein
MSNPLEEWVVRYAGRRQHAGGVESLVIAPDSVRPAADRGIGQRIMMGQGSHDWRMQSASETKIATMGIFVYLVDVDTHYERARAAGAEIVQP